MRGAVEGAEVEGFLGNYRAGAFFTRAVLGALSTRGERRVDGDARRPKFIKTRWEGRGGGGGRKGGGRH